MALSQPGQRKWRGASCRVLPGGYNYRNKNNEPAKNLGKRTSACAGSDIALLLLVGCDNSVAQNAAPLRPPSMLLMWL
jgi:hypothetical protein